MRDLCPPSNSRTGFELVSPRRRTESMRVWKEGGLGAWTRGTELHFNVSHGYCA